MMAWVAFDRGVKESERLGLDAPINRWRTARQAIHADVCKQGFNAELGAFVQYYGSQDLDASLLMMAQVGFLPPTDPRVLGTVKAIERHLMADDLVARYAPKQDIDGLPPAKALFCHAPFGWPTTTRFRVACPMRAGSSNGCCESETTSASCPRSMTLQPSDCWATSRKPFRMSP